MTTTRRAGVVTTALLSTAFLLAACGGSTPSVGANGGGIPSASTATDAPSTTGTATDAPDPSALAIPSFDLDDLAANLDGVDSYRLVMSTGGAVSYETRVVTKPELRRDVLAQDGTHIVIIGDEVWAADGPDEKLQPVTGPMAQGMMSIFDPMLLMGAFMTPGTLSGATDIGSETKNGVTAQHFRIDSSSIVGTLASMPPGSSIDMWVAEDGYLVSLQVVGDSAGGFAVDVFDVNDPSIVIERP